MIDINETDEQLGLPVHSVFHKMSPEYRAAVVARALSHLDSVAAAQRNDFLTLVRDNVKGVGGFRDSSKAPIPRLRQPVAESVMLSNSLACGVIALWIESHTELKRLVEVHLESAGIAVETLDLAHGKFEGEWPQDTYEREMERFGGLYSDFDEDDVGLMFHCVSGKIPVNMTEEGDNEDHWPEPASGILAEALAYLRSLPITAPEWVQEVPGFIRLAIGIMELNVTKREKALSIDSKLSSLKASFADLLEFFECDTGLWTAENFLRCSNPAEAVLLASELESLLAEYQNIHLPAPVMSEERERAVRRADLQGRILETIDQIGEALASSVPTSEVQPFLPPREIPRDSSHTPAYEQVPNAESPGMDTASPPASELDAPADDTGSGAAAAGVSMEEYESVQSLNLTLEQDKERLEQEVKRLESELYESQQKEEGWRTAYYEYDESRKGPDEDIEGEALGLDDVAKAVARAAARFQDRLLFQLNSDSTVDDNPFERPDQVWKALQWLATTYYDSRLGDIAVTDFDLSVREACGWWYKGSQGETTLTRYSNSYTTRYAGKTYWLKEHIGKGTNRDARYTIRIAFDWDRERKAVVVGYIGRHQQTDQS